MEKLLEYAKAKIAELKLGDSSENCHGVVAYLESDGVRLSDGVGFDVIVRTESDADEELAAMADWYAESE